MVASYQSAITYPW